MRCQQTYTRVWTPHTSYWIERDIVETPLAPMGANGMLSCGDYQRANWDVPAVWREVLRSPVSGRGAGFESLGT